MGLSEERNIRGKAIMQLLRFLAGAGPKGVVCDVGERLLSSSELAPHTMKNQRKRLIRSDGRALTALPAHLRGLVQSGAVAESGTTYHLTGAGRKTLKRLLAGDFADFGVQHRDLETGCDADMGSITVNLSESPLSALGRLKQRDGRHWISADLIRAGDRLRADFTSAHIQPTMGVRFDNVASRGSTARSGGMADLTDAAVAARQRFERALRSVGPELAGPLVDVCCYLKGLETIEMERQWPKRSAKLMLRAGLERLARHYAPPGTQHKQNLRSWGEPGYRPDIVAETGGEYPQTR